MPATTPKAGRLYAANADVPHIGTHTQNLALDLEDWGKNFTSTALRDSNYITPAVPATGDVCKVAGKIYQYHDGAWWPLLDTSNTWQTLTLVSGYLPDSGIPLQCRLTPDGSFVELKGRVKTLTSWPTGGYGNFTPSISGTATAAQAIMAQVSASYASGPICEAAGITDGSGNAVSANLLMNARSDGGIRVQASGSLSWAEFGNVRFPT